MKQLQKIAGVAGTVVFSLGLSLAAAGIAHAATLTLSPSSQTVNVGDTFTVQVLLNTQGQSIDGVDLNALNYNPYNLQMVQFSPGGLMPNTVANSVDSTNGRIVFSQITNGGSTYTGSGTLATVTFKALVAGTTPVTFNFTPGATTDSNVASQGNDILSSVINATFIINNAGGSSAGTGSAGGSGGGSSAGGTATAVGGSSAGSGSTQTTTSLSALLALLNQLKAQLKALVIQAIARGIQLPAGLAESLGINPTTGTATSGTGASYTFTRNLTLGSSGNDVLALQQFLNGAGYTVSASGAGSPGNEVIYFGAKTQAALIKYQAANGLPATGFFGPLTQAKLAGN